MNPLEPDPREKNLPRYAQVLITNLRDHVEAQAHSLADRAATSDANVWERNYSSIYMPDGDRPIGKDPTVYLRDNRGREIIYVRFFNEGLFVNTASDMLQVRPSSGNAVFINSFR